MSLPVGKLTSEQLQNSVLSAIGCNRSEVVLRPGIGEDCGGIRFGDDVCVLSTDPVTAAVKDAGKISVHISANDVVSAGAEPIGLMITLLAPPDSTLDEIETLMGQIAEEAKALNIDIVGGHTEVTPTVNSIVICSTVIGKVEALRLITSSQAKSGDTVIMTKWAAMEGSSIIASDYPHLLTMLTHKEIIEAQSFCDSISVVPEGLIAAKANVSAMHDVTEGGILGAVYEVAMASGSGMEINIEDIPVLPLTKRICGDLKLDPLKLISSGCMLICTPEPEPLIESLTGAGIKCGIIGRVTRKEDGVVAVYKDGSRMPVEAPCQDEIYKVRLL